LANHGFSLKTTDQKEKPWVLEEASGMQAEAKSKDDLMPLVANILKRRDVVVTRIGEISVRVRVYSLRCFNDWRMERAVWQKSGRVKRYAIQKKSFKQRKNLLTCQTGKSTPISSFGKCVTFIFRKNT
jgi:hypothetical protein